MTTQQQKIKSLEWRITELEKQNNEMKQIIWAALVLQKHQEPPWTWDNYDYLLDKVDSLSQPNQNQQC